MDLIKLNDQETSLTDTKELLDSLFAFEDKLTYFIIISIDRYLYHNNQNLTSKYADDLLEIALQYFPNQGKSSIIHLFNETATKSNINNVLTECRNFIKKDDNLIIYLSGLYNYDTKNLKSFIPFDAKTENDFISTSVLYQDIIKIPSNTFLTIDWESNSRKNNLHSWDILISNNNLLNIYEIKSQQNFHNPFSKEFSKSFATFLANKSNNYIRENFLFLHNAEAHFNMYENIIKENTPIDQLLTDISFNPFQDSENQKLKFLLNYLIQSLPPDSPESKKAIEIKFKLLELIQSEKQDLIPFETALCKREALCNDIHSLITAAKKAGYTVVLAPEMQKVQKKKILITTANPEDSCRLRLDTEVRKIEEGIRRANNRDDYEVIRISATRITDLQEALLMHSPNFVHFSGHGSPDGICLVDNNDSTHVIKNDALGRLFDLFSADIECIFLNSCYSKKQAEVFARSISHVIGMNDSIADDTAIEFSSAFYKSIANNRDIKFSFKFAVNSIDLNDLEGINTPVLLSKQ